MHVRFLASIALIFILGACNAAHPLGAADDGEPVPVSITLDLSLAEIGAERIDYTITHPTLLPMPIVGSLSTAIFPTDIGTPPPVTFALILPVGTGYQLELAAYEADGDKICDGASNFDVLPDVTTLTGTSLTCRASETNP